MERRRRTPRLHEARGTAAVLVLAAAAVLAGGAGLSWGAEGVAQATPPLLLALGGGRLLAGRYTFRQRNKEGWHGIPFTLGDSYTAAAVLLLGPLWAAPLAAAGELVSAGPWRKRCAYASLAVVGAMAAGIAMGASERAALRVAAAMATIALTTVAGSTVVGFFRRYPLRSLTPIVAATGARECALAFLPLLALTKVVEEAGAQAAVVPLGGSGLLVGCCSLAWNGALGRVETLRSELVPELALRRISLAGEPDLLRRHDPLGGGRVGLIYLPLAQAELEERYGAEPASELLGAFSRELFVTVREDDDFGYFEERGFLVVVRAPRHPLVLEPYARALAARLRRLLPAGESLVAAAFVESDFPAQRLPALLVTLERQAEPADGEIAIVCTTSSRRREQAVTA
jgi:hypothetical protein